jgi:hypothetical protein
MQLVVDHAASFGGVDLLIVASGHSVQQINLAGGGGNSDVWCQIFADVLNVEARQVQNPIQANVRGGLPHRRVGRNRVKGCGGAGTIQASLRPHAGAAQGV